MSYQISRLQVLLTNLEERYGAAVAARKSSDVNNLEIEIESIQKDLRRLIAGKVADEIEKHVFENGGI